MKQSASIIVVFALLFVPVVLLAAEVASQPSKTPAAKEQEAVKITLHPMAATRPALKYQLLPPFLDRRPGNAAVRWNRLSAEQTQFLTELNKPGGLWEKADKWMALPIGDPREKEFRAKEAAVNQLLQSSLFAEMDYAARFESCDWELPLREGHIYAMTLPEVQMNRTSGHMLAAKAHGEIIDKKYGDAVRTFQTGLALARQNAHGQTLIHALVGSAIATSITNQIEQFIQQPDAPNLYWALSVLPQPLIDYRPAWECEMNGLVLQFPELRDLDKKKLGKEQWDEALQRLERKWIFLSGMSSGGNDLPDDAAVMARVALLGPAAKQYLVDRGRKKADVDAMPQSQAILLYTISYYEELRDDEFKVVFLPQTESGARLAAFEATLRERGRQEIIPIASLLLPALANAKQAEVRVPWTIARLRIVEALRIYAAAHQGQLPERLSDLGEVPLPVNPYDGKPFTYHRDGNRAVLGCESGPRNTSWRYEITMVAK